MRLKIIKVLILILMAIPLGSCRNFSELDERNIVLGAAVDFDKEMYSVTVEVVDNVESTVGKLVSKYYTASGKSIFDAVRNIIKTSGKRLFWSHTKVLILSRNIKADNLYPVIDWVNRDQELREDMMIVISQEKTAKEIIGCKPAKTAVPSNIILGVLKNYKSTPKYPEIDFWKFSYDYSTPGIEPIAPAIKIITEDDERRLQIGGTAVFLNYAIVGFLGEHESMNLLFLRNKVSGGLVHLDKNITKLGTDVVLEIMNSSTKIEPKVQDGKVIVEIAVKPELGLAVRDTDLDLANLDIIEQLNKTCSSYLEEDITETIKTVQQNYKSDIFGFGQKINSSLPSHWKDLKSDWNNNFSNLDFIVKVDAEISVIGLHSKPLKKE